MFDRISFMVFQNFWKYDSVFQLYTYDNYYNLNFEKPKKVFEYSFVVQQYYKMRYLFLFFKRYVYNLCPSGTTGIFDKRVYRWWIFRRKKPPDGAGSAVSAGWFLLSNTILIDQGTGSVWVVSLGVSRLTPLPNLRLCIWVPGAEPVNYAAPSWTLCRAYTTVRSLDLGRRRGAERRKRRDVREMIIWLY